MMNEVMAGNSPVVPVPVSVPVKDISDPLTREALGLIWAARRGLSETELLRLLKPADLAQKDLTLAAWSTLRAALEEWVVDRSGILNFAHESLRAAVETAVVPDEDRRDELRLRLADDFGRQPISARSCDELPWLLFQTESYQRLRHCLLDIDRFLEIQQRDHEELRSYWAHLGDERTMGKLYVASFEQWSESCRDENRISHALNGLGRLLMRAGLPADAEPFVRRELAMGEKNHGPEHPAVARDLNNLASVLESSDRLAEAEPLYRRALNIFEKNLNDDHPDIGTSLNNLAQVLKKRNRLAEAEPMMLRALQIFLKLRRTTQQPDPRLQMAINNYKRLLDAKERNQIR